MSRSVEIDSVETRETTAASKHLSARRAFAAPRDMWLVLTLFAFVIFGFGLRVSNISAIGFAEDETNKLEAVRAYRTGDISPNAEHPMLMKSLAFVSMEAARVWNSLSALKISDEAALRFPNILFGALTVIPLFLLTQTLFDRRTALITAALWAFGINSITYNRIAKEDTLLVFFMLYAFYFYLKAKLASGFDMRAKNYYYTLAGASFGLMMASKYFPHYLGLNMLYYHLVRVREPEPGEPRGYTPRSFFIALFGAFLVANPAFLLPKTWTYLSAYTSGQLLTHTGYLLGDRLYNNTFMGTPFRGTPFYFYLLYLMVKVPLPVIIALVVGLVEIVRRPRRLGNAFLLVMFLFWIVPYSLVGSKWLRYTLSLLPFVYMIAAVGIALMMSLLASALKRQERLASLAATVLLLFFVAWPAWTAFASAPHYAAYTNALGGYRSGYYFPHDEFYDDGLREAIEFVAQRAPEGSVIVGETPGVFRYYLEKFGRTDLEQRVLSDRAFELAGAKRPTYVILQRGRTYFENREKMQTVRDSYEKVFDVRVQGTSAAEVYLMK